LVRLKYYKSTKHIDNYLNRTKFDNEVHLGMNIERNKKLF